MTSRGARGRSPAMWAAVWAVRFAALPFLLLGVLAWGMVVGALGLARVLDVRRWTRADDIAGAGQKLRRISS